MKVTYHFETFIFSKSDFIKENTNKNLFIIMITAAKKNVSRLWLRSEPPTVKDWIDTIKDIYSMERITHTLNLQMDFKKVLKKWIAFVEKRRIEGIQ